MNCSKYELGFISDDDIFSHVRETVGKYRFKIDLQDFNRNLVDPIKLTFDSKVYGRTIEQIIESEALRQIDKSNTNHIGYFHQNIFKYFEGWNIPSSGFDVVNESEKIFVEIKNKHNTMNSASAQKTYMRMQNKILRDDEATCYLLEVIAKASQDIAWKVSVDSESMSNKNIRRISVDKFYEIVTGEKAAFERLCNALPSVIEDVVSVAGRGHVVNSVFDELFTISPHILKSLYLLAFQRYQGFESLKGFNDDPICCD